MWTRIHASPKEFFRATWFRNQVSPSVGFGKKSPWDRFERDLKLRAKIFLFKSESTEHVTKQSNLVINSRRKGKAHQDPARNLPATRSNVL